MKLKFGKKKPDSSIRQPHHSGQANAFSYYASRSPSETTLARQSTKPKSKTRHRLSWHMAPIILALGVMFISLGYLLWIDINPRIELITLSPAQELVLQNTNIYQKAGQEILAESPLNRFKLTVDTNELANKLKTRFPELREVVITTPIAGHQLIFKIQSTTPVLALSPTNSNFIILDERGRAVLQMDNDEKLQKLDVPVILDESGVDVAVGNNVLPADNVSFITQVIEQLKSKDIAIQSISLPPVPNELHVRPANQKYYVKFNIVGDARLQSGAFIATKKRLEGEGKLPSAYIDVRTEDKVYYQ